VERTLDGTTFTYNTDISHLICKIRADLAHQMTEVNLISLFFSHEDRTKAHEEQLKNKNQRASMQKLMYFLTSLSRAPLFLQ